MPEFKPLFSIDVFPKGKSESIVVVELREILKIGLRIPRGFNLYGYVTCGTRKLCGKGDKQIRGEDKLWSLSRVNGRPSGASLVGILL